MSATDFILPNRTTGEWEVYYCCQRVEGVHATKEAAQAHLGRIQKGTVHWQYATLTPPDLTKEYSTPAPSHKPSGPANRRIRSMKEQAAGEFKDRRRK
jgi:hypothetical protein